MKGSWDSKSIIHITFYFFFLFSFGDVFSVPTSKHLCRPEQRDALIEFKTELGNGNCSYMESWTSTSDCCDWEGIMCNAKSGEVIELDLSGCLHGRFHFNISFLNLQNLHSLTTLDLSFNLLTGPIPSSIGNLYKLTYLDLSSNQFSGPIPSLIGNLYNLTYLNLSTNQFSGQIPSSIEKLTHLNYLDISNNKIKGQVPGWLWTLPNLTYLTISNNNFIDFERPSKHGQSSIRTSGMKHLFGSNNNFMCKIPSSICKLRSLRTLDLSNNNFTGPIPRCIGNLKNTLSNLNLRRNRLSGDLPEDIFKTLRSLDVGHNQIVGKLPRSLVCFSSLEVLNVESNKLNDTFPFWLSSLKNLKILVLRSNVFHGPIHQASFSKLRIIDISHNYFNGTLPSDYFMKWHAMSSIDRNESVRKGNYIGDKSGYYDDSMVLTSKGVEMKLLRILLICRVLDFSGNKFEGEIPRSVGLLKELHVLNLSNNAFNGHIPSSVGNLTSLESLDVSQNKLSGEIPQELGKLSFLEYVNFSQNQLEGLVPGGTQFRTQPCSSFKDNMGLFGPSLDQACMDIHTPEPKNTLESEEEREEVISWKAALIGFGPGLVFGMMVGYILGFPHFMNLLISYWIKLIFCRNTR